MNGEEGEDESLAMGEDGGEITSFKLEMDTRQPQVLNLNGLVDLTGVLVQINARVSKLEEDFRTLRHENQQLRAMLRQVDSVSINNHLPRVLSRSHRIIPETSIESAIRNPNQMKGFKNLVHDIFSSQHFLSRTWNSLPEDDQHDITELAGIFGDRYAQSMGKDEFVARTTTGYVLRSFKRKLQNDIYHGSKRESETGNKESGSSSKKSRSDES